MAAYLAMTDKSQTTGLGAMKVFKVPDSADEATKAKARFDAEVQALREISHPSLLKLLDSSDKRTMWMVTEYHPGGTLASQVQRFKGNASAALAALRPVVDGVAQLHRKSMVHRDIKPLNLFFSSRGDLVLGDSGIVFFEQGTPAPQRHLNASGHATGCPDGPCASGQTTSRRSSTCSFSGRCSTA